MKRFTGLFLAILFIAASASAAGTVSVVTANVRASPTGPAYTKYTVTWVSDGSGDVTGNSGEFSNIERGVLIQTSFTPDGGGTQPTDLYDATLTFDGVDVLDGVAANLSNSTSTMIMFDPPIFYDATSNLDLVISNAGASNAGTFVLWVRAQ